VLPTWQGLFSRSINNDDLLPKIRKPVLITHGAADAVVKPAVVAQHKGAMPHAQVQLMATEFGPAWTREPGDAWELFAREGRDQRGNIT